MRYLTEEGKMALETQKRRVAKELIVAGKLPPGSYAYRLLKRYMDGLDYLLDLETVEIEQ